MATVQQSLSSLDRTTLLEERTIALPSQSEIAALAYALWEEQGCPHGNDLDHWLRAEQILREKIILPAD